MSISKLITDSKNIALLGRGPSVRYLKKKYVKHSLNFQNLDDFTSKIVFSTDTLTLVSKELCFNKKFF